MKKVVVFSTGGTIAMKMVPGKGVVPACSGADLVEAVPGLASVANIEVRDFSNLPRCQMTPALMFRQRQGARRRRSHERAYFPGL